VRVQFAGLSRVMRQDGSAARTSPRYGEAERFGRCEVDHQLDPLVFAARNKLNRRSQRLRSRSAGPDGRAHSSPAK
jgi:hypothetical protein